MSTISLPLALKARHLAPAWLAVIAVTAFYCELSRFTHGLPPAELDLAMLWNLKVWGIWAATTAVLATGRGRTLACSAWRNPFWRCAMLVLLPSLAFMFEWKAGALFDAAGWLEQPDSPAALLYRRLPLFGVALTALAVFLHGTCMLRTSNDAPRPQPAPPPAPATLIHVSTSRGPLSIPVTQIEAIVAAENYVELFLVDGRQFLHRATLTSVCEALSTPSVIRIHRSVAVNLDHVAARLSQGRLRMQSGRVVRVGRAFRAAFKERWGSLDRGAR